MIKIWNLFRTSGSFRVAIQKAGRRPGRRAFASRCTSSSVVKRAGMYTLKIFRANANRACASIDVSRSDTCYTLFIVVYSEPLRYCTRFTRPNNFVHCLNSRNRAAPHRMLPNFLFMHLRIFRVKRASNDANIKQFGNKTDRRDTFTQCRVIFWIYKAFHVRLLFFILFHFF